MMIAKESPMTSKSEIESPLISAEEIRRWQKARDRIADEIGRYKDAIKRAEETDQNLMALIAAGRSLLGSSADTGSPIETAPDDDRGMIHNFSPATTPKAEVVTWTQAIIGVVSKALTGISYDDLRAALKRGPAKDRPWSEKSFHGAMQKLSDQHLIVRYKHHAFSIAAYESFQSELAAGVIEDLPDPTSRQPSKLGDAYKGYLAVNGKGVSSGELIRAAKTDPELAASIAKNKSFPYNVLGNLVSKKEIVKIEGLYYPASPALLTLVERPSDSELSALLDKIRTKVGIKPQENEPPVSAGGSESDGAPTPSSDSRPAQGLFG